MEDFAWFSKAQKEIAKLKLRPEGAPAAAPASSNDSETVRRLREELEARKEHKIKSFLLI